MVNEYDEVIASIMLHRDSHLREVKEAERRAVEEYDKRAEELTAQYSHLIGRKVKNGGIVRVFRGFKSWMLCDNRGFFCKEKFIDFYPVIMKLKKDGTEGATEYKNWDIYGTASSKFELTPVG